MPRRKVELVAGEFYHVYNRGCDRRPIFFERENYYYFIRSLRKRFTAHAVDVAAWCLMPNHYHFLLRPGSNELSDAMQEFGTSYTKAINKQRGRTGTLFEGRFQAIHVDSEEYLLHLSRYIHLNPVEANLVRRPEDWESSSYRDYIGMRRGTLASPELVLRG